MSLQHFSPYPAHKNSGDKRLGAVPIGWGIQPLKRVAILRAGAAITADSIEKTGDYPVFGGNGVRGFTSSYTNDGEFPLIGRQGALCGCVNFAIGKFWASEHAVVAEPRPGVDSYWLLYLLESMQLNSFAQSAAQPGLAVDTIRSLQVAVPSVSEQRAIAAFLNRETARIGELIAKKEQLIELLHEERSALITRAVANGLDSDVPAKDSGVDGLGEIPKNWGVRRLKHLTLHYGSGIQMGPFGSMLKEPASYDTGYKLYGQENTITGDFNRGSRWLAPEQYDALREYQLRAGDIVVTRKGSIGNARLTPNNSMPGVIDSDTIRIRVDADRVHPEFMVLLLHEAFYVHEQIFSTRRGAVLSGLNTATVGDLVIALPPLDEQDRLVREASHMRSRIERLSNRVQDAIDRLRELRAALIAAAVSGKIDVQDSEQPVFDVVNKA